MDYEFGQFYYAFKGIPYAKPPVKTLRFKAPVEVDSWSETLMATEDGNLCPQYDISQSESIGENFKCSDHFSVTRGLWSVMHCNHFVIIFVIILLSQVTRTASTSTCTAPSSTPRREPSWSISTAGLTSWEVGGKIISSCESNSRNIVLSVSQQ